MKQKQYCLDGFLTEKKKIDISQIEFKEKQPVKIEERSKKYAKQMKQGKKFPPIQVFGKRHKYDTYQVFDGHARLLAHKLNKKRKILAEITLVNRKGQSLKCKVIEK